MTKEVLQVFQPVCLSLIAADGFRSQRNQKLGRPLGYLRSPCARVSESAGRITMFELRAPNCLPKQ